MPYENITISVAGNITTLTLDRPGRLNALSADVQRELIQAAGEIAHSGSRAVVIRGEGRVFCAGVDVSMLADLAEAPAGDRGRYEAFKLGSAMADAIEAIPQVTVAELHGFVVGGGVVLAAACDLRVAADDTIFSIPEVDLGIPLAWGGIERLVREFGPTLTKELVMTGRQFTAQEAKNAGFLNAVVAPQDVTEAARELARTIAAKPQFPIAVTKAHVAEVLAGDTSRDDALSAARALDDPESITARELYLAALQTSS